MLHLNFNPFPILETEHLVLRRLSLKDERELFFLRSDKKVNQFIDRPLATSITDVRNFINVVNENTDRNEGISWTITVKGDDIMIGTMTLWNIVPEQDLAEVGYTLMPAYEGKGIMQEALQAVIQFGFDTLQLKRIEAFTHKDNERSKKLLERNGFVRDKNIEEKLDEREADLYVYALEQ
ncbi:MAG: GNAT family N-acetyltransferase [Flavipsychrobacter sp.]